MIVIESTDKIIKYDMLSDEERQNLNLFFEHYGKDKIIEKASDKYITYKMFSEGKGAADIRVKYNPDMMYAANPYIVYAGYAIAVYEDGTQRAVLGVRPSTYEHHYTYDGGADMWFLNLYDCIFLNECNEFSIELCQSVLKLWTGKRIVLVGYDWEELIPMLPDLQAECFYEPELNQERFEELSYGMKYLYAVYGAPHAETMERYEQGIVYYDEIMSFTFMFSDYRQMGEKNPDKNFFVMDGYYGPLGLFAMLPKVEVCARYAKSKGMIPVIRLTMCYGSCYADYDGEDIWAKFFEQPEGYTLEEVMSSKNVFFSPGFYNGSVQSTIMDSVCSKTVLTWPDGIYNSRVRDYISERKRKFLPYPENTLGVLARGTDYVNTHLPNHPVHAGKEMLCEKIDEMMASSEGKLKYIYLATEDASYCEYFKERYKDKIYFTDQERYTTKEGETLSDMHKKKKEKREGFLPGAEYITSITLLSQCRSLLASGGCGGYDEAVKQNIGKYEDIYLFNLGVNP